MDLNKEIENFVCNRKGGITVIDSDGVICFADKLYDGKYGAGIEGKKAADVYGWYDEMPDLSYDEDFMWEGIDTGSYYQIRSSKFAKDGKDYTIHQLTDITEYMSLNRDVTKYMSFFKRLSKFQSKVLENLAGNYYELLPMLSEHYKCANILFVTEREEKYADIINYNAPDKNFVSQRALLTDESHSLLFGESTELIPKDAGGDLGDKLKNSGCKYDGKYICLCKGSIGGQYYGVYMISDGKTNEAEFKETALLSVVSLYIENTIMREKLIYESEHDALTGLYNKGKYLAMYESTYKKLDSIAIFNMDVNNLKKMNDTYGHEAGDKLLIKAADSIRKVTTADIHGYRMGGDEYLMIAANVTKEKADEILKRWEDELARLNTYDDGIECVIAVGLVHGNAPYDYDEMMHEADALMYEDKKRKKKPGEEIR